MDNENTQQEAVKTDEQNAPQKPPRKKRFNSRAARYGALSAAFTVIFIAAVVVLNVIVTLLSERFDTAADLTGNGVYTLDEMTEDYLKNGLSQDVTITVLSSEQNFVQDQNFKQVSEILRKMSLAGPHIKVNYLDLDRNPNYVSRFKGETLDTNYIVAECESTGRHKVITPEDYFGLSTEEAMYYYYYYGYVGEYLTEQETVSALIYVTNDSPVRVAFTEGFGETDSTGLKSLLSKNGYDVETVSLLTTDTIDPDIDILIVHAPLIDMDNTQLAKLDKFLENGGKFGKNLFYFASVTQPRTPNIDAFLSDWGLSVGFSDIGQTDDRYRFSSVTMFAHLQQICDTKLNEGIYGSPLYTIGADIRPVFITESSAETVPLMTTYDGAFLYPLDYTGDDFDIESAEHGTFNVAAASEKTSSDGVVSRVAVFGSEQFSGSYLMSYTNVNNSDYFVNLFNVVTGKTAGISIKPKTGFTASFEMSAKTANTFAVVLCAVIPVCVIALGIAVWLRRRHI